MTHWAGTFSTPLGSMAAVIANDGALTQLDFLGERMASVVVRDLDVRWDDSAIAPVAGQLAEYFAGDRRDFNLVVRPAGGSFHQAVWAALLEIPYGRTVSYGAIARKVGQPGASRAVGRANGANPIPIVIPCHRVIGANGDLTGYGGGLPIKTALLQLEGVLSPSLPF